MGVQIFGFRTHGNSLLGAISPFGYNFAERNADDAPANGASDLITIYNKYDYGKKERLAKVIVWLKIRIQLVLVALV